ncbi:hypothetical protein VTL71DRAFT_8082 [Oculimacula yallundae]|uniref:Uncharacterized protein n=1 Tax=Oculimacula yallundae TaxID=86028 RepID=A0ABR4CWJ1_9HELO
MDLCGGAKNVDYTGKNVDGSGVYVDSDSVSHPYKFPKIRKCWYEYYVTGASLYDGAWTKASGDTYCTDTLSCTVTFLKGIQTCQSRTDDVSATIGVEMLLDGILGTFGLNLDLSYTHTQTKEACQSASNSTACAWGDGACHTVFISQQLLKQQGYRRKRCNWGDGDVTECMADLEVTTPTDRTTYQCGAECGREDMVIVTSSTSALIPSTTILSITTQLTKLETATLILTFTPSTSSTSSTSSTPTTSSSSSSSSSSASPALQTASSAILSSSQTSPPAVIPASQNSDFSTGAKIGVAFGTITFVALIVFGILHFCRKRPRSKKRSRSKGDPPRYYV